MASDFKEREAFSRRLRVALAGAGADDRSPTRLAREFNRRYKGEAVSVYAAHKWLRGEALPTQDKLRALAAWLGVTPEWLRFGESAALSGGAGYVATDSSGCTPPETTTRDAAIAAPVVNEPPLSEGDLDLLRGFRRLSAGHRQAVRELILALERAERQRL